MYFTKHGTTPMEYRGLLEAVNVCRARQKGGLDLQRYPLPYWAEKAYLTGVGVFLQVENSESTKDDEDQTFGQLTGSGDSGAFSLIHKELIETRKHIKDTDE